jgi:hypothetical protein
MISKPHDILSRKLMPIRRFLRVVGGRALKDARHPKNLDHHPGRGCGCARCLEHMPVVTQLSVEENAERRASWERSRRRWAAMNPSVSRDQIASREKP